MSNQRRWIKETVAEYHQRVMNKQCAFFHWSIGDITPGVPAGDGLSDEATMCVLRVGDKYHYGLSFKSKKDQRHKQLGNSLAFSRAVAEMNSGGYPGPLYAATIESWMQLNGCAPDVRELAMRIMPKMCTLPGDTHA